MVLIILFTFIAIIIVFLFTYKYITSHSCNHQYEIDEKIPIYKNDNATTPGEYKYIQVCKKCGKIKTITIKN